MIRTGWKDVEYKADDTPDPAVWPCMPQKEGCWICDVGVAIEELVG